MDNQAPRSTLSEEAKDQRLKPRKSFFIIPVKESSFSTITTAASTSGPHKMAKVISRQIVTTSRREQVMKKIALKRVKKSEIRDGRRAQQNIQNQASTSTVTTSSLPSSSSFTPQIRTSRLESNFMTIGASHSHDTFPYTLPWTESNDQMWEAGLYHPTRGFSSSFLAFQELLSTPLSSLLPDIQYGMLNPKLPEPHSSLETLIKLSNAANDSVGLVLGAASPPRASSKSKKKEALTKEVGDVSLEGLKDPDLAFGRIPPYSYGVLTRAAMRSLGALVSNAEIGVTIKRLLTAIGERYPLWQETDHWKTASLGIQNVLHSRRCFISSRIVFPAAPTSSYKLSKFTLWRLDSTIPLDQKEESEGKKRKRNGKEPWSLSASVEPSEDFKCGLGGTETVVGMLKEEQDGWEESKREVEEIKVKLEVEGEHLQQSCH